MPRCDDCSGNRCGCVIEAGPNVTITGSGTRNDPYVVEAAEGGEASAQPTGVILDFAGGVAPTGWLMCDGGAVSRTTYAALFAVCGTTFGPGDGTTTFNLPDAAGRFRLGADGTHPRGSIGGVETHTLVAANLPPHSHTLVHTHSINHDHGTVTSSANGGHDTDVAVNQSNDDGTNNSTFRRGSQKDREVNLHDTVGDHTHTVNLPSFSGTSGGASATTTSNGPGSSQSFTNMPPWVAVTAIIKT